MQVEVDEGGGNFQIASWPNKCKRRRECIAHSAARVKVLVSASVYKISFPLPNSAVFC